MIVCICLAIYLHDTEWRQLLWVQYIIYMLYGPTWILEKYNIRAGLFIHLSIKEISTRQVSTAARLFVVFKLAVNDEHQNENVFVYIYIYPWSVWACCGIQQQPKVQDLRLLFHREPSSGSHWWCLLSEAFLRLLLSNQSWKGGWKAFKTHCVTDMTEGNTRSAKQK